MPQSLSNRWLALPALVVCVAFLLMLHVAEAEQIIQTQIDADVAALTTPAHRLLQRVEREGVSATLDDATRALAQREQFLHQTLQIQFIVDAPNDDTVSTPADMHIALRNHAAWLRLQRSSFQYQIDTDAVSRWLEQNLSPNTVRVRDGIVQSVEHSPLPRVRFDSEPQAGFVMDEQELATAIAQALQQNVTVLPITLEWRTPVVRMNWEGREWELHALASGVSNYAGSGWGRAENIRKALADHVQQLLLPKGESLSFNETLQHPISGSLWWADAFVIKDGKDLELEPGGGICQVATTLYRAALQAGLPIDERRNHSLYVQYYERYGVGLDATIYPGQQDLVIRNDTPGPLVFATQDDGSLARITVFGVPDGRSVSFEGPYTATTAPQSLTIQGRPLQRNEIAWSYQVASSDGSSTSSTIVSRYRVLPTRISQEFSPRLRSTLLTEY